MSPPARPDPEGWRAVRDAEGPAGPADAGGRVSLEPTTAALRAADARRQLWLDSATIVVGILLALALFNAFGASAGGPGPAQTPTDSPDASGGSVIGTLQPPATPPPEATLGPVVDPSIGLDATPTPVPFITLGPTANPTATPRATPKATPRPTPRPTPKPSAPPTPTPTPADTPTDPPTDPTPAP